MNTAKRICIALVFFFLAATAAHAHMIWLTPDNRAPRAGETVTVTLGFGHHFSPDEVMEKADRMERVFAVGVDGKELEAKCVNPSTYVFTPETDGPHAVYAVMKSGCMSTTTAGRKMGDRKTLEGVVSCFGFKMAAMTNVACGNGAGPEFGKNVLDLEIIPRKDPSAVRVGETLPVLVLFQGKPLAGAEVSALGSRCRRDEGKDWDQELKTGDDGVAVIKITESGPWLISARHKIPYADPTECDDMTYNTTLTLDF